MLEGNGGKDRSEARHSPEKRLARRVRRVRRAAEWRVDPSRDPRPTIINLFTYTAAMMLFIQVQVVVKGQTNDNFLVSLATTAYHLPYFVFGLFFGRLGDFIRRRTIVLLACLVASLGALLMGFFIDSYAAMVVGRALTGIGMGMLPGALYASTFERGASVGIFTALGSLGWAIGSFLAPALGSRPLTFFIAAAAFALPAILAPSFRELPPRPRSGFFSFKVIERHWPVFLGYFLRHAGAMAVWVTFTLYLKERGISGPVITGVEFLDWIGLIYALNPIAQVSFMLIMDRINPRLSLPLGYIATALLFTSYVLFPNPWVILPMQIILAFSWSAVYLGSLLYLNKSCHEERSTVSGTFNAVTGLCGIAGSLLGGLLSSLKWNLVLAGKTVTLTYEISMLVAAAMAVVGLAVLLLGERKLYQNLPVSS